MNNPGLLELGKNFKVEQKNVVSINKFSAT